MGQRPTTANLSYPSVTVTNNMATISAVPAPYLLTHMLNEVHSTTLNRAYIDRTQAYSVSIVAQITVGNARDFPGTGHQYPQ